MKNSQTNPKTPRSLGFRMPAEWEKHESIWLAWPHDPTTFPNRVKRTEEIYLQIIKYIHESENVNLFVTNPKMEAKIKKLFEKNDIDIGKIQFFEFNYADVWFRDYGPIFVIDDKKTLAMVHWVFNSWGEKYPTLLKDRQIPLVINREMGLPYFAPGIVLEGGSIDVNGEGSLLTTKQCLLNINRNPSLNKNEIEKFLTDYLNANHIIWLKRGIEGDDTDGHIDDIARFVNHRRVLCAFEENQSDENYKVLNENYKILKESKDQDDKSLTIIKLPMPKILTKKKKRLPASYANFYIGNKTVLVPIFKHVNDEEALSIIKQQFPNRKIEGVDCSDLVYGLGAIHCITQQQPERTPKIETRK